MSSIELAIFIVNNPALFEGKTVLDMGCGTGIQGIAMALGGAAHVICSDISIHACENSKANIRRFGFKNIEVICGDLFERVENGVDLIVFALPYFPAPPIPAIPVTIGMLNDGELISRFLAIAGKYCNGPILMPFMPFAGQVNDPSLRGPENGFTVNTRLEKSLSSGIQIGEFRVHELMRRTD